MTVCPLTLTDSHIMVGNGSNQAADVAMSGDVTINNTGVTTIKTNVALAGSPTTTTQSPGDNSTKVATTAYVDQAVGALDLANLSDCIVDNTNFVVALGDNSGVGATLANTLIVGSDSLTAGGSFDNTTILGEKCASNLLSGDDNTIVGAQCLVNATHSGGNTIIGKNSGNAITTGHDNILIGKGVDVSSGTSSFQINIGGVRLDLGISATITTAALTGGGSQGSMTFTNGILTAQTQAT